MLLPKIAFQSANYSLNSPSMSRVVFLMFDNMCNGQLARSLFLFIGLK